MRLSRARARVEKPATPDPVATAPVPPAAPLGAHATALGPSATAPDAAAPGDELIEKFVKESHDLGAVRKSVEDAASVTTGLWLSYLFVLVYIGIAAGAVKHQDLFLENPVKLPFLSDVPLPLVAFFILAPIVFIVSHTYTLVHFVMLAGKVGVFNKELRNQLGNGTEIKECLRWQLPANIFVQILAGPARLRKGRLGLLSNIIAWISLVIGPLLLLLLIQVQFLPFHSEGITWLHRGFVLVDVVLLWALWPTVVDGGNEIIWLRPWRHILFALGSSAVIGIAVTAATFPGEWLDEHIGNKQWIPPNHVTAWLGAKDEQDNPKSTSFHDLLFNGPYDEASQRRRSLFSNTLVLPGFDALVAAKIDDSKLGSVKQTIARKNGHFESAIFRGADLRKINLENAHLQGADLYEANLLGAQFYNANLKGVGLYQAKLQCVSLGNAQLQGASLDNAQLQGAWLGYAQLQGASLKGAMLQGAALLGAQLQGASLKDAQLQGADFRTPDPQTPDSPKTILAGTDLGGAAVWRANFKDTALTAVFEDGLKEDAISKEAFDELKDTIEKAPEGEERKNALDRIGILDSTGDIYGTSASAREFLEKGRVDFNAHQKARADQLKSLVCSSDDKDVPRIVRGLTGREGNYSIIKDMGAEAPGLVEAILGQNCPVSAALTEDDKAALKKIENAASGAHSRYAFHPSSFETGPPSFPLKMRGRLCKSKCSASAEGFVALS